MKVARITCVVLALAAPTAVSVSIASASYNISACEAVQGGTNNSWNPFDTNASYWETGNTCSSAGFLYTDDVLGLSTNIPQGTEAGWTFTAPAGTTITGAAVTRDFFKHDNNYLLFVREADGTMLDSGCTFVAGSCEVSGSESWNALSTSSISVGAHCSNNSGTVCGNGATLHDVFAHLSSATITLVESASPSLTSTGGPLLAGGWQSGSQNGTISATDNTGIQYLRVYVDNTLANTVSLSCDFTFPVPCSAASNVNVLLNTAGFSDGGHQVQLAAVNAAGNETRSSAVNVNFDNTAPGAPVGMSGANVTSGPIGVSWSNPSQGAGSPIAKVHWQACRTGVGCTAAQNQTSSLTSLTFDPATTAPFSSSPNGSYTISVWLEDAAGNTNQANAGAISVTYGPSQTSPGSTGSQGTSNPPPSPATQGAPPTTATKKLIAKKRRRHCVVVHRRRRPVHKASSKRSVRHRARCLVIRHRSHSKR